MTTVKIVKVLGTSEESWDDAADEAVRTASETIEGITGVEVEDRTAKVEDGEITEYKTTLEVAFPVRASSSYPVDRIGDGRRVG